MDYILQEPAPVGDHSRTMYRAPFPGLVRITAIKPHNQDGRLDQPSQPTCIARYNMQDICD